MAVPLRAAAAHRTAEDIKGSERGSVMALVVMEHYRLEL